MNDSGDFQFDHEALPAPPEAVARFIEYLVPEEHCGEEQRRSKRHALNIQVPAVPVDGKRKPIGAPFVATSRDISPSGIALLHTRPVREKFLLIELLMQDRRLQVVLEVLRCRAVGRFYEIAGRFVSKTDG